MILGLICARKNSKRLPGKNLLKINNKSLLARSIEHGISCKQIDKVVVSTDCPIIANEGKNHGADIPFLRPDTLALDTTPEWKVWQYIIKHFKSNKVTALVILPTTAPMRQVGDIDNAIDIYNNQICDGVLTVTEASNNPSFNMVIENKYKFAELAIPSKENFYRSQDAPKYYNITTVCYVMNPNFILKKNSLFEGNLKLNFVPKERSVDIDTEIDFLWAQFLFNHYELD